MPRIELVTRIAAPPERVFDLSRSVELHLASTVRSAERMIAGTTRNLMGLGDEVTWEARHLGVRQRLSTRITRFDRPQSFRDSMLAGTFARFDHDHAFEPDGAGATIMRDTFDYTSPLGALGRLADRLFLERYMTSLLRERNALIVRVAESDAWRRFLTPDRAPG